MDIGSRAMTPAEENASAPGRESTSR
jgi:hypothetical protein